MKTERTTNNIFTYKNSFLLRKYKEFFQGFYFLKYKKFSWAEFFYFFELENLLPEI